MDEKRLDHTILALLFASEEPLSARKISSIIGDVAVEDVHVAIDRLKTTIADFSSIMLERLAGGYQLSTNPDYAEYIARLYSGRRKQRLTRPGMETLAIIAYKQPITRADIEHIRGVACGGVITTLMERSLIRIVGKAKVLGAPFLYGTTQEFLEYLGLNSIKDLPSMEELEELLEKEEAARSGEDSSAEASDERHVSESDVGDDDGLGVDGGDAVVPDDVGGDTHTLGADEEVDEVSAPRGSAADEGEHGPVAGARIARFETQPRREDAEEEYEEDDSQQARPADATDGDGSDSVEAQDRDT